MGIFQKITDAILGPKPEKKAPTPPNPAPRPAPPTGTAPKPAPQPAPAPKPTPIGEVDVEAKLSGMKGADDLNWRSSIVDLMKLLGIDSSFANRKELATEMGDTNYSGTAEENIWLHKRVMQELAKHGGKVPAALRD